jgi:hypothetical protein
MSSVIVTTVPHCHYAKRHRAFSQTVFRIILRRSVASFRQRPEATEDVVVRGPRRRVEDRRLEDRRIDNHDGWLEEDPIAVVPRTPRTAATLQNSNTNIAKELWKNAVRNCRDRGVWERLVVRLRRELIFLRTEEVVLAFHALAKMKYKNKKVLDELSFQMLKQMSHNSSSSSASSSSLSSSSGCWSNSESSLSPQALALLFNSHKKLEYRNDSNLRLLMTA